MQLFGHHIPRAAIVLTGLDLVLIFASIQLARVFLSEDFSPAEGLHGETLAVSAVFVAGMFVMGLYEREYRARRTLRTLYDGLRIAAGLALGLALLTLFAILTRTGLIETDALIMGSGLAFLALVGGRSTYCRIASSEAFARRIAVLGVGSRALVVETLNAEEASFRAPYKVVSYIATAGETSIDVPPNRVFRLRPGHTLRDAVRELNVAEIVVAVRDRRGNLPIRQLLECKLQGITVTDLSSFCEREHQQLQLDSLNASWLVFGTGFHQTLAGDLLKRGFDLVTSSLLLVAALPVMLLTAAAIRLEGPGPILYWQTRVGRGNREFEICKFRSMRTDAEQDGLAQWAVGNDSRVTRVGHVIRKLRIDELPQVVNVFKGEMSFVGPRPERPFFVNQLSEQIPYFLARHSLRPGITGWAQVRYPYGASVDDAKQKLQYDLYYVKNHTLFLDIVIMLETVKVVLFGRGAR